MEGPKQRRFNSPSMMRRFLHEKDEANHQRLKLHDELKHAANAEHALGIVEQIKSAEETHEKATEDSPCSFCKKNIEAGRHVAVQINSIYANAGIPLIKDFPEAIAYQRPHFYLCFQCAIDHGVVTQNELDTGRREDNLNE